MNLPARYAATGGLARLGRTLMDIADEADGLAEQGDVHTLALGFHDLKDFQRQLNDLVRHVEEKVAGLVGRGVVNFDDEIVIEVRGGKNRRQWKSVELLRHIVGDQLINPETGENVFETLVRVLPLTASTNWRVTELKKLGVDPADWCEESPGRTSVQVTVREGE